ncbi:MAG TPA: glycosyltransferase family 87 protein [Polyangiaceae bacterium]
MIVWAVWWAVAIYRVDLPLFQHTLNGTPAFGVDFTTQPDLAARAYSVGKDPYALGRNPYDLSENLFHYPPLVLWLFSWTPLLQSHTALRIWVVFNIGLVVFGTLVALRVRRKLPIGQVPAVFAVAAVLFSSPVIFELERANFDLITLAAMLAALPLLYRGTPKLEFLAGCILAMGPWVKLYPGLMALGLLALRRWRATAGFVVVGVAIFLLAPHQTLRSLKVLHIAVERAKPASFLNDYAPCVHSLSVLWGKLARAFPGTVVDGPLRALPVGLVAGAVVITMAGYVCFRMFRMRASVLLVYPLLLWLNALGSCVGLIANDYSLAFLPLAVMAVASFKDPWFVKISLALLLVWWQPVALGISGVPLLAIKMLGLIAVGVSLIERTKELALQGSAAAAEQPQVTAAERLNPVDQQL